VFATNRLRVLPQVLDPMASEAPDEEPRRSRDRDGSDDHDRRDERQAEGVHRRRIKSPERQRRPRLQHSDEQSPLRPVVAAVKAQAMPAMRRSTESER
jgi:hypothetical protein